MAREALVREAEKIDPDASYDAGARVVWIVQRRIADYLRHFGPLREVGRSKRQPGEERQFVRRFESLDKPLLGEDGPTTYVELLAAPDGPLDPAELLALREAVAELPDREREFLFQWYVLDKTWEEIGVEHGVTGARAMQIGRRGVRRLRAALYPEPPPRAPPDLAATARPPPPDAPPGARHPVADPGPLSQREIEVLVAAAEGLDHIRTAARLRIAPETVKTHRKRVIAKLQANGMPNAIAIAVRAGIID